MRNLKETAAIALAVVGSAAVVWAQQQDFSKVNVAPTQLAPGVFMLTGAGGNLGVSTGDDGVLVIDSQFAPMADKIHAALTALSPKPLKFLINTHCHGDHTGGNEAMAKNGASIIAHDNVRKRLSTDQFIAAFNKKVPAAPPAALPVVTFDDELELHWNGDDIHVIHVSPAHTDGDSIIRFEKANVIHTGDVFVTVSYPFADESSGGDFQGFIAAADRILSLSDDKTKIIPGHGVTSAKKDVQAWRDMLVKIRDRVQASAKAGKTLAQVQAEHPTKEWDAKLGGAFVKPDAVVETVFHSVAKKPVP